MILCMPFSRLSRLSGTICVANTICIRSFPFQDYLFGRSFSYASMMGGKKVGSSPLDKNKKHKAVVPIWKPISTSSECISNVVKIGLIGPIEETVHCEESLLDESTSSLTSRAARVPDPIDGKDTSPLTCKKEYNSEVCDKITFTEPNSVIQQVEIVRENPNLSKSDEDSDIDSKDGKYSISIQVDSSLIRFIKGKWGLTQKQIEEEMGVKLIFPSAKGDTSIVIEGASIKNVTKASEKITNVLAQAVKSPNLDYSHFVSLPLAINPELVEKLQKFQNSVLGKDNFIADCDMEGTLSEDSSDDNDENDSKLVEGPNIAVKLEIENNNEHVRVNMDTGGTSLSKSSTLSVLGIDRSIFIEPRTFHLTVLMLKLWNKDRVAMATEILKGVSSKVMDALENRPVSIRLRGLACMRGSPAKARVLYTPVEEVGGEGRLLRACQVIIDAYVEAGLVMPKDASHSLKLHATLMNARHRKRKKWTRRNDSFDARGIFKMYGSEDWGEYLIPEAHLSQRFAFDESGYYHCCRSITFPGRKSSEFSSL